MKKITFLLFFFVFGLQVFAQSTCTQTFTVSGQDDDPTVLTINASSITCNGTGTISSMRLINAAGSLVSGACASDGSDWFGFDLSVDGGTVITGCAANFNNVDITGFSSLTITSHDDDNFSDGVTITIDVEVTFTATAVPGCTTLSTPTNGTADVLSSQISWPVASGGATGYKLNVGTTTGGTNVLNMQDVGNVLTYDLGTLTPGTTYYVKVTPYNAIGDAVACAETSFTTCGTITAPASEDFSVDLPECWQLADGGDLTAGPSGFGDSDWSADGFANNGTTGAIKYNIYAASANDWIVSPMFTIPATGYELKFDAAATQWNNTTAPTTPWESDDTVEVLVSTGLNNWTVLYTYNDTNVPSNVGTTNIIDLDAYAGQNVRFAFRAVEGTADGGADIDFSIDNMQIRLTPACVEPTGVIASNVTHSSADIAWSVTTGNYQYVLDQVATNPAGAGTAITTNSFNATPLAPSTTYYFHVRTDCGGTFSIWTTVSFTTLATPPANDNCANATALTAGGVFSDNPVTGTNVGATSSAGETAPGCANYSGGDVWFSVVVPASGNLTFENNTDAGGITDSAAAVYSGVCGALVLIDCDDSSSSDPNDQPLIQVTGRTPGEVLYYRVWEYGNNSFGTFKVSAYDASLSTGSFDTTAFKAYPNPVKNVLNLSYATEISSVEVYNMLGQNVMTKTLNVAQGQIDMSNLNAGNYIVKFTADGVTQTIKVIKQ
ncbi:T9SS type A sorting domain-containing protein [Flavobacterium limnosediminis]|nr:T9SS type A sorting domain-containing protein [Flavobacterium limnosediminis]